MVERHVASSSTFSPIWGRHIAPHQFCFPICQCPLTCIFQVLVTISFSVFLSDIMPWPSQSRLSHFLTYVCHSLLALISSLLIFSLTFVTACLLLFRLYWFSHIRLSQPACSYFVSTDFLTYVCHSLLALISSLLIFSHTFVTACLLSFRLYWFSHLRLSQPACSYFVSTYFLTYVCHSLLALISSLFIFSLTFVTACLLLFRLYWFSHIRLSQPACSYFVSTYFLTYVCHSLLALISSLLIFSLTFVTACLLLFRLYWFSHLRLSQPACSYFVSTDFLNPIYSHHPYQHSYRCSW